MPEKSVRTTPDRRKNHHVTFPQLDRKMASTVFAVGGIIVVAGLFDDDKFEFFDQLLDVVTVFRGNQRQDFGAGGVPLGPLEGFGVLLPSDEPVGDVDVGLEIVGGGVLLEDAGDRDVEAGEAFDLLAPGRVAIDIGERDDITAGQDVEAVVELTLAAGGEPDVLRHQGGADDGCLFRFHEGDSLLRVRRQQVFSEKALRQLPFLWQSAGPFHQRVNPRYPSFRRLVLDAVAGVPVVFHNFPGPAAALNVNLEEDYIARLRESDSVVSDDLANGLGLNYGAKPGGEVTVPFRSYGSAHNVARNQAERLLLFLLAPFQSSGQPFRFIVTPVLSRELRMLLEILRRSQVIAAAALVVTSSDGWIKRIAGLIDIQSETALAATARAGVTARRSAILLKTERALHPV